MKRRSTHLRDGQDRAITGLSTLTHREEGLPETRESEVIRLLLDVGIEEILDADLSDLSDRLGGDLDREEVDVETLLSEAAIARYRHNRFEELEGWLRNQRTGYRSQVARHFKRRFKNGYSKAELSEFAENMRVKAHYLWPGQQYEEERLRAIEYVEEVTQSALESVERSDVDPLDPETLFDGFEGVESAQERKVAEQVRESELYEAIVEDLRERVESTQATRQDSALVDAVVSEFAVEESVAREALAEVRGRPSPSGEVDV